MCIHRDNAQVSVIQLDLTFLTARCLVDRLLHAKCVGMWWCGGISSGNQQPGGMPFFPPPFCGNETRTEISNGRGMITMLIGQYAI
jgi:hypothetical protein